MSYKVEVEVFKGPMDLLLSLIKKQEIDIYDIPINIITDQFLDYINEMEELNLEITSEFLVMAATLIEIKSKMLLPKEKALEDGVEIEIDPRDELVQRLVEYEAYREVAEKLKESEIIESKVFYKPREDLSIFDDPVEELGNLDLDKLLIAINTIISYFGIHIKAFAHCFMFCLIGFIYIASYLLKFCEYHRMFLHYIIIIYIINCIDYYIGIPLNDYNLFILYSIITIISLFLILYFKIKNI